MRLLVVILILLYSCSLPGEDVEPVTIKVKLNEDSNKYNVKYNLNGATSGVLPIDKNIYTQGDLVLIKGGAGILKNNSILYCWNSAPDGTGALYEFGQLVVIGSSDLTLYAQWHK